MESEGDESMTFGEPEAALQLRRRPSGLESPPRRRQRTGDFVPPSEDDEPEVEFMSLEDFERATVDDPGALRGRRWSADEVGHLVDQLAARWTLNRDELGAYGIVSWAAERFDIPEADLGLAANAVCTEHASGLRQRVLTKIGVIMTLLEFLHDSACVPSRGDAQELISRCGEVQAMVSNAAEALKGTCRLMCTGAADGIASDPYALGNRLLHLVQPTKLNPFQHLILDLNQALLHNGWRQFEGNCYEPVVVEIDGRPHDTHAWAQRGTIEETIAELCNHNLEHGRWVQLTAGRNMTGQVAEQLKAEGPHSFEFPRLKFNRRLWAFADGCYCGEANAFYPHEERRLDATQVAIKFFDIPMGDAGRRVPRPRRPGVRKFKRQFPLKAAHAPVPAAFMVFHAADVAEAVAELMGEAAVDVLECAARGHFELQVSRPVAIEHWIRHALDEPPFAHQLGGHKVDDEGVQHIARAVWRHHDVARHLCYATPRFDQILLTQHMDLATCSLIYALFGRMMYEVGEKDGWQVVMFIIGKAGSGKSLITRLARHLYPAHLVANLSNNCEVKFGLSGVANKFMWLCPEVKKNFCLDQAEFQQMVSGEELVLNVKHQTPRTLRWTAPGMLCGNEVFAFEDSQESLFRRIAAVYFDHMVEKRCIKTNLFEEIVGEVGEADVTGWRWNNDDPQIGDADSESDDDMAELEVAAAPEAAPAEEGQARPPKAPKGRGPQVPPGPGGPEFAALVRKCNVAYRNMVRQIGQRDIWDPALIDEGIVPPALHRFRTKFRAEIDSVVAFLEETDVIYQGAKNYMTLKGFQSTFAEWTSEAGGASRSAPSTLPQLREKLVTLGYDVVPRDTDRDMSTYTYSDPQHYNAGAKQPPPGNHLDLVIGLYYRRPDHVTEDDLPDPAADPCPDEL
jgi:hypothetical protein